MKGTRTRAINQGLGLHSFVWHVLRSVLGGMLCSDQWFFTQHLRRILLEVCALGSISHNAFIHVIHFYCTWNGIFMSFNLEHKWNHTTEYFVLLTKQHFVEYGLFIFCDYVWNNQTILICFQIWKTILLNSDSQNPLSVQVHMIFIKLSIKFTPQLSQRSGFTLSSRETRT